MTAPEPRTVTNLAPDSAKGMTLDDLVQFTRDCVAAGMTGREMVHVVSTMDGRIKRIRATRRN
jgi:hypothetical protein